MTDLSNVKSIAQNLKLSESAVDTPGVVSGLAALKREMIVASTGDVQIDEWLTKEHMAGGVLATAATMNKRAELKGSGNRFDAVSRSEIIARYNAWAQQLVGRIDTIHAGTGNVAAFITKLTAFHSDPVRNRP